MLTPYQLVKKARMHHSDHLYNHMRLAAYLLEKRPSKVHSRQVASILRGRELSTEHWTELYNDNPTVKLNKDLRFSCSYSGFVRAGYLKFLGGYEYEVTLPKQEDEVHVPEGYAAVTLLVPKEELHEEGYFLGSAKVTKEEYDHFVARFPESDIATTNYVGRDFGYEVVKVDVK
jgi:hypothetical protein